MQSNALFLLASKKLGVDRNLDPVRPYWNRSRPIEGVEVFRPHEDKSWGVRSPYVYNYLLTQGPDFSGDLGERPHRRNTNIIPSVHGPVLEDDNRFSEPLTSSDMPWSRS